MSGLEDTLKAIIEDNKQFRDASNERFAKLLDVMQSGTADEFSSTISEIFNEVTGREDSEVLGGDGRTEPTDGSARSSADAVGGQAASQES